MKKRKIMKKETDKKGKTNPKKHKKKKFKISLFPIIQK